MDRELTKAEINGRRRKQAVIAVAVIVGAVAVAAGALVLFEPSIKEADLRLAKADRGTIETSIAATGKVAPAFEEIINSPIASRIIEVYCKAGDSVAAGTPLMRLDLQSAAIELKKLSDEHAIKQHEMRQSAMAASTAIANLEMQIKVKEMQANQLGEDVCNEQRLDSLGSGTGERIRQAQLVYKTALLELEQLRQQLNNEAQRQEAAASMQELELSISASKIAQMQRTLDDASLKAPRAATLTFIVNEIGRQVNAGERVAVIADLTHFKVEGQIADSYAPRLSVGSKAIVLLGKERLEGSITNIAPQSQGGTIDFSVALDDDSNPKLRPGLSMQVHVITDIKDDVLRIPNCPYYNGPGSYSLFVRDGAYIEQREVKLGHSNYEYVEVLSGLQPGDELATSDMRDFVKRKRMKIRE